MQDYVQKAGEQMGITLQVADYVRVQVGEGLEKADKDFAAEVADALKSTA